MPSAVGKRNQTRKILSFFRVNFGHNPPYEVLCDGPTIFQSLSNDLYLKQALPKLLGGPAYPVVTECVVNELRCLGDDYSSAALFAKRVKRLPCLHEEKVSVAECLASRLRNLPDTRLMLASTDPEVVAKVARIPGVPAVSIVNQTKFALKAPSSATLSFVKESEKTKTRILSDPDRALVNHAKAEEELLREKRLVRKKRKRAKGPNPLSIKKAKVNREKSTGNPLRRSSLLAGSAVSLDSASLANDICNDKEGRPASNSTSNEGYHVKVLHNDNDALDAGTEETKRKGGRQESDGGGETPDVNIKKAIKNTDESRQQSAAGSFVTPKDYLNQKRKRAARKDDNVVAIKKTGDLSEGEIPKSARIQDEKSLPLEDSQGNGAGELQPYMRQGLPTKTSADKGVLDNSSASMLIESQANSWRPQAADGNELTSAETESVQLSFTGKAQRTKISSKVHENHNKNEPDDAVREGENIVSSADNAQLIVMDESYAGTVGDVETASASMNGKKKQRKNRRRRPKKSTSN